MFIFTSYPYWSQGIIYCASLTSHPFLANSSNSKEVVNVLSLQPRPLLGRLILLCWLIDLILFVTSSKSESLCFSASLYHQYSHHSFIQYFLYWVCLEESTLPCSDWIDWLFFYFLFSRLINESIYELIESMLIIQQTLPNSPLCLNAIDQLPKEKKKLSKTFGFIRLEICFRHKVFSIKILFSINQKQ